MDKKKPDYTGLRIVGYKVDKDREKYRKKIEKAYLKKIIFKPRIF